MPCFQWTRRRRVFAVSMCALSAEEREVWSTPQLRQRARDPQSEGLVQSRSRLRQINQLAVGLIG